MHSFFVIASDPLWPIMIDIYARYLA